MRLLFLFLDGVGLGADDPKVNPFAAAEMPNVQALLGGRRMLADSAPCETQHASLLALDACLGVAGLPQSATGQAVLLTGQNVPAILGYHYGPKPNPPVAEFLKNGNLFYTLTQRGLRTGLVNAYPPRYFDAIQSGRRLYSAIPLAVTSAGLQLLSVMDLSAGRAISADLTGEGWRTQLKLPHTPLITPEQAGTRLADLAQSYHLAFFEYWLSDYAGHHQDMDQAISLLESLDRTIGGITQHWDSKNGLILLTSDHGNLEDLSTRRHTTNPVPLLLIGDLELRRRFTRQLHDLTGITPAILDLLA